MEITTESAQATEKLGQKIGHFIIKDRSVRKRAVVVTLTGELGSGKTTFTRGLARGLGISGRILSPTFTLIREHAINNRRKFIHIDLYRLPDRESASEIGLAQLISDPENIVVIEWPKIVLDMLPGDRIDISFSVVGGIHQLKIKNNLFDEKLIT